MTANKEHVIDRLLLALSVSEQKRASEPSQRPQKVKSLNFSRNKQTVRLIQRCIMFREFTAAGRRGEQRTGLGDEQLLESTFFKKKKCFLHFSWSWTREQEASARTHLQLSCWIWSSVCLMFTFKNQNIVSIIRLAPGRLAKTHKYSINKRY